MKKIPKQEYTAEFRELAAQRIREGVKFGALNKELGVNEQTLRNWVKAADSGKLSKASGKVITPEQMELSRLRVENIRLKRECEILKNCPHGSPHLLCVETLGEYTDVTRRQWPPAL